MSALSRFKGRAAGMAFAVGLTVGAGNAARALVVQKSQVILEGIDDYELCQSRDYDGGFCHDALRRWVKTHPGDAFKAGKLTRAKMNAWAAIPFFAQAFDQKQGDCADEDVSLAVVSALDLPDNQRDVIGQAKKIGLQLCFEQMKDAIKDSASVGSNVFKNACEALAAKRELSGLKLKKCQAAAEPKEKPAP